ncbi:monosaccharide ABC transporter ATP-binding protein, CUT2 family [Parasphaerochaeta coccoides DSM 17374]|uniref:Monosaccharide ABC transporter ATP-binding protein, CUT2 family n=2 Tax=Parasphaerochaeta TaxID=3062336 RepID=F4GLX0_PARC1|nr:monosaccharide ABC transporter ATP-binding protein, CUT2 family [Parasphaerochaeta coccoides DSM 17374]
MILDMQDISKAFGSVQALKGVSLHVGQGEVHGILGENGAGKTTLMNILAGTFPPDSGHIFLNGEEVSNMTPMKAMNLKIRFIHQELNLCNDLKVYENMFLGEELTKKKFIVDKKTQIQRAQAVLDSMKAPIDANANVDGLETAQKQLVEIARALLFQSELIIMDEPTTALNNQEIENLFSIMRELKGQGVSFIYISHKMPELFAICDKYTVLRDGEFIETGRFRDIDVHRATELLIGKVHIDRNIKEGQPSFVEDSVVMAVKGLRGQAFHDVTFDLYKNEILFITGLQGSGTNELAMALFGASPLTAGEIMLHGQALHGRTIKQFMRNGVGMVPRNRKERGILPDLSIRDNTSLAYFTVKHKKLFISDKEESERFERNKLKMDIRSGSQSNPITSLSGGNQQKVIIGKWLEIDADVYIMDNPTQGIDVGTKFAIYELIDDMAKSGKSIIVFSNEYPEIHQIADRCLIMYKGRISGILNRTELSEVKVMEYSTGSIQGEST